MPLVQSLMDKLQARYGRDQGERVYYAMEAEGKGPFAPGAKYRHLHEDFADRNNVPPVGKRKPPAPKKPRARKRR